jgi:hypothetical protein
MIVFIITSIETVGDTSATMEASRMAVDTEDGTRRIKGAMLNDGVSGIFSALATSLPLTTFAQNNGVISLTNVAARQAGFAAAFWLFLLGILGECWVCVRDCGAVEGARKTAGLVLPVYAQATCNCLSAQLEGLTPLAPAAFQLLPCRQGGRLDHHHSGVRAGRHDHL